MTPYTHLPHSHNGLKAFEAVARHMSFTHAAIELNVTQSAISRQIKQLETELELMLIVRHHRSITLTEHGKQLGDLLKEHFTVVQHNLTLWKSSANHRITIKVAMSFAIRWFIPKLKELNAHFPQYEMVIIPTLDEESEMKYPDYDLLFLSTQRSLQNSNLDNLFFIRNELMAPVCAKPITGEKIDVETILSLPRLHATIDHHDWRDWLSSSNSSTTSTVRNTTFSTLDLALSACLAGQGATMTDLMLILPELEEGFLQCPTNIDIRLSPWRYYCHRAVNTPIINELIDWIKIELEKDSKQLTELAKDNQWTLP
ncbi:LysR family transcriptional regulator [Vibrio sp. 10N.286.49.B3]|uniref:LysR family transcriptional regulator n=1 Tax=Vibrio sp. 10N.286.49.B3 TaxID=1880855 RepID=UPI000C83E758|nr:LysR family transcriptional regulator [Vibrio sp. 10N.286.49.B3]PMH44577.1 LysR family transcriptional regulator [Vibrio sp. 10N.286.49.B3]